MNKYLVAVVSVAMLAGSAAPALAQDGGSRGRIMQFLRRDFRDRRADFNDAMKERREDFRDEQKENRDDFREERKENREDFRKDMASRSKEFRDEQKERFSENRKQRIKQWWARVSKRLSAIIERQYRIAAKIENRLNRLDDAGRDVSEQREDLADARAKIDAAKRKLADATAKVDEIIAGDTAPKESFRKLHELHKGVIAAIRDAHRALIAVLVSTRGLSPTPTPTPSATPTPTATP